jgi:hypothetical protein
MTLLINGKVLVAAGVGQGAGQGPFYPFLSSAELYDPVTQTFTATGDLNVARWNHTATLLKDGRVLVVGGDGRPGLYQTTAELYDPNTESWTLTGELFYPRFGHTATLLSDGRVIVAGGFTTTPDYNVGSNFQGWPAIDGVEIFNPDTGMWLSAGRLTTPRVNHVATRLYDGRVLVVGGGNKIYADVTPLGSSEVFIAAKNKWMEGPKLNVPRVGHTVTLLKQSLAEELRNAGRVLVAGGSTLGDPALDSCEIFEFAREIDVSI